MRALRGMLMALVLTVILLPVIVYVVLSSAWASDKLRQVGEDELSQLLGTSVDIGSVKYSPFNMLEVADVAIDDDNGVTALRVNEIEARFELWDLLLRRKFIIDYATISGLDLKLYSDSAGAPLNIARIIDRLKSDDQEKPATMFNLRLNDVRLDDCSVSYNVLDADTTPGRFNPRHLDVRSLRMAAFAPMVSNDNYRVRLRSLSFTEQSGLTVTDMAVAAEVSQQAIRLGNMHIALPNSLLDFDDIEIPIDSLNHIDRIATTRPVGIALKPESHVYLADLKPFVPILGDFDYNIGIDLEMAATRDSLAVSHLALTDMNGVFRADVSGTFTGIDHPAEMRFGDVEFSLTSDTATIASALYSTRAKLPPRVRSMLGSLGHLVVAGTVDGTPTDARIDAKVSSRLVSAAFDGRVTGRQRVIGMDGHLTVDSLALGTLLANSDFRDLKGEAVVHGTLRDNKFTGEVKTQLKRFDYKGYRYTGINAGARVQPDSIQAALAIDDPNARLVLSGSLTGDDGWHSINADVAVGTLRLDTLGLTKAYPGYALQGRAHVEGEGESIDRFKGEVLIDRVHLRNKAGEGIDLKSLYVNADNVTSRGRIVVISDYLNGTVDGDYRFSTIGEELRELALSLLPALEPKGSEPPEDYGWDKIDAVVTHGLMGDDEPENASEIGKSARYNDFVFDLTLSHCDSIGEFLKLPAYPIADVSITGNFDAPHGEAYLMVDMPWVANGNSIIHDTTLALDIPQGGQRGNLHLNTMIPTKKGKMDVRADVRAYNGNLDTNILWTLEPEKPISGNIDFTTILSRNRDDRLVTQVKFNPGTINFGDEIWNIQKSLITYSDGRARIDNFALNTYTQALWVNGVLGPEDTDQLTVDLKNIQLLNIFETLEIENVYISGSATGTIHTSALLGKQPVITCESLDVRNIGYNYCTLGNAVVKLSFDDGGKVFNFNGRVTDDEGRLSYINGFIVPATEQLDLNIEADHIRVGFMKPFMSAFTSSVSGYASGRAHLFGDFHNLDMEGSVYAEDLSIKIDFTNTVYHASDSIHIERGKIKLDNIVLQDEFGHTAMLNGWVAHEFFHNASFEFNIDHADDFLCYDVTDKLSPRWYGRIFGDGRAQIKGQPGTVDIIVDMSTAAHSTFSFVMTDQEEADEYSFITFRDATPVVVTDNILERVIVPDRVIKGRQSNDAQVNSSTAYSLDIVMNVSPNASVNLVMDPVGGDCIRATGSGMLRVVYDSSGEFKLYGKYTLDQGKYNFTLQDIIIKEFTIQEGSTIQFDGDPYTAKLDINAYLQVNANLTDLDESFQQDKELNRTNVPVRAMLHVTGDLRQFGLSFGLEFPTLSEDISRKVHSIISTDDMMSKQIIYLLALNRFYTPEYMGSTTKGNELFSVASSTISSQLSSMLGKLSDNWSIAPNLRSDRGDFSDLEVDVALSSSLLNNRLLLNGNFGYRDKSLNTNQFVGDFDVEYLLNRSGEWRLKAYNRYNDQNYYLRSALTTQGVGVVYRRDFDRSLRFINDFKWPWQKDEPEPDTIPVDPPAAHPDSILIELTLPNDTLIITPDTNNQHPAHPDGSKY